MNAFSYLLDGFAVALQPVNLLYCTIGVLWGTVVGVLPGLGPLAGLALLLPLTFQLEAHTAIIHEGHDGSLERVLRPAGAHDRPGLEPSTPDEPIPIRVAVDVRGSDVVFDFTGSSPQVRGAINCTLSFVRSAVYFALRSIMDSDAPNNAGFFRPVEVRAAPGSILNPRPPGACAARGVTGFRVIDAVVGALSAAVPERVRAPGEGGTTSYSISGYDADGGFNMYREAVMGNWGGGLGREGLDGVSNPAANIGNAPCEVVEQQAPLRVERYELVPDSGGAGQWRGGLAVLRQLRYLGERATLQLRSDRRHHRPFGICGGGPGAPSTNQLFDGGDAVELPTKFVRTFLGGQVVRHVTAGAGGYGDPFARDPGLVLADVRNGKVTPGAAEKAYGVRVDGPPWRIDEAATARLRLDRSRSGGTAETAETAETSETAEAAESAETAESARDGRDG